MTMSHLFLYCAAWAGSAALAALGLPAAGVMLALVMLAVLVHKHVLAGG